MVKHMCGLCGKVFGRKWNLVVHLNNIHDVGIEEKSINCVLCGYQTSDKRKFFRHMKRQHPTTTVNRSAYKLISSKKPAIYECKLCNRSIRCKNFKAHQLRVHNIIDGLEGVLQGGQSEGASADAPVVWIKTENEECDTEINEESNAGACNLDDDDVQLINTENVASHTEGNQELRESDNEGTDAEELGPDGKTFKCSFCTKEFKNLVTLKKHHLISHKFRDKQEKRKSCSICQFCPTRNTTYEMLRHFKFSHNLEPENSKLHFKSVSDFFTWKLKEESETCVKFGGRRKFGRRDTITFTCNRSGYCITKSKGKRRLHEGFSSIKINGYCPANMRATRNPNGTVVVEYQKTHVGHEKDYKQVFLSETERRTLANNLASNNTPTNDVWLDVRGPLYFDDLIQEHLSTKEVLRSTQKSINVCAESKKYDPIAIDAWVSEIKKSKDLACLYFKKPDSTDDLSQFEDSDFVLFFMFKYQKEMFQKYGHRVVCFDCTNNVNAHNIQMYTLMVSDDASSGFPCVFMFSNRHDEYVFRFSFQKIRDCLGMELTPNVFMSDVESCYHTAWCTIMGTFPKRELLCSWRVLESWRAVIAENVKTKLKRQKAFKTLETMMFTESKETFKTLLDDLYIQWNADSELQQVYNHFVDSYCRILPIELWAHCHRISGDFNCHMDTKNYNNILKIFHLYGTKSAMLDKTLVAILRFMGTEMVNMLTKMNRTLVVAKLYGLKNHHRNCFRMNLKDVQGDDDGWNVLSPNNETFRVKKIDTCRECTLPCTHCESCFHEYSCSCPEYNLKLQMCAHIHLVCRSLISKKEPETPAPELFVPAESLIEEMEVECHQDTLIDVDIVDDLGSLSTHVSGDKTEEHAEPEETKTPEDLLKEEFSRILSKRVESHAEVQFVKRLLSCMESSLISMKKQKEVTSGDLHRYLVATLDYSKKPVTPKVKSQPLQPLNPPHNVCQGNKVIGFKTTASNINNRQPALQPVYAAPNNNRQPALQPVYSTSNNIPLKNIPIKNIPLKIMPLKNAVSNTAPLAKNIPLRNIVMNAPQFASIIDTEEVIQPPYADHEYLSWKTKEVNLAVPTASNKIKRGEPVVSGSQKARKNNVPVVKNQTSSLNNVQPNAFRTFLINNTGLNIQNNNLAVNSVNSQTHKILLIPQSPSSMVKIAQNSVNVAPKKNVPLLEMPPYRKISPSNQNNIVQSKIERKLLPKTQSLVAPKPLPVLLIKQTES